jgi:dephospho-CoA kinase
MLRLGLTGSIATGKSTVLEAFAALGVPTFSSDAAVHELYRGAAVPAVEALFPGVTRDGQIDRAELSRRLVGHPEKLRALEQAVHPLVRERIAAFLAAAASTGAPLAVVDIPLLFENGFDYGLDKVAVTAVDAATQRRRALARPGMSVEKLEVILARQVPQAEKIARADYVFDTAGPLAATRAAVARLVAALRETA